MKTVKKKEKQNIMEFLYNPDVRLYKIEGVRLPVKEGKEKEKEKIEFLHDWNYNILKNDDEMVSIEATSKMYFSDDSFFNFTMVFRITYSCEKKVSDEDITACIEDLLQPCGNHASMMLSILTGQMVGTPLIIPPYVEIKSA